MSGGHPYRAKTAALATKHGKLDQIGPALSAAVGIDVALIDLDTDVFGTFTGEVERTGDTLQTAIAKARAGADAGGLSLGIASEGSFGPHPTIPFVPADLEIVVLVDLDRGFHVAESVLTTHTNFSQIRLSADESPNEFARKVGFPDHGLVVQPSVGTGRILKGIRDEAELLRAIAVSSSLSPDGLALVQTDMRAHCNPTRQIHISEAAKRLGHRLSCVCPACGAPGWGEVETVPGLPCELCGWPTDFTLTVVDGCPSCHHRTARDVSGVAEANYCPMCNP